jgi:hypothetical protein
MPVRLMTVNSDRSGTPSDAVRGTDRSTSILDVAIDISVTRSMTIAATAKASMTKTAGSQAGEKTPMMLNMSEAASGHIQRHVGKVRQRQAARHSGAVSNSKRSHGHCEAKRNDSSSVVNV